MTSATWQPLILTLNCLHKDSQKRAVGAYGFCFFVYFFVYFLHKYSTSVLVPLQFFGTTLWLLTTLAFPFSFISFIFIFHIFILITRTIYFCSWRSAKFNLSHRTPKINSRRKGVVEDLGPDCKLLTGVICHFASRIGAMKVL